jgi:3-deoxy-manno-octulosonate cytidylyltransferase (CMP-KDO synthetase)
MAVKLGKVIGVIPARLESERLPRKVLRPIAGHPMIVWVYRRAREAAALDELLVATESKEIRAACRAYEIPVEMTSSAHRSGTERIIEVMSRRPAEIYVNIQGDEPMVTARHVELLLESLRNSPRTLVSTLKVPLSPDEARDPNHVKVVTDSQGLALYFSRAPIPYERDPDTVEAGGRGAGRYFKHLGIYAYRAAALEKFRALARTPLEHCEKLEQLRFLEKGIAIAVAESSEDTIGVDQAEDLKRVEEYFARTGATLPPGKQQGIAAIPRR